ncbi:hypothetical protein PFLmoz3_00386 [Pseudomonas fluorescens]|uniref:Uncharacterized protein n=1 Tax=Pseudomonas fluorescens TaxID=294 RepID=A0A120G956_PSEFL|nr:hypothetical protein PFLmoz3_00386 [Pseudomonas fluorescens]
MEHTIRLTPGHSSHSTSAANCGPLLSAGRLTRPLANSHGPSPPHASKAPSSRVRPTRMPMMPPNPSNRREGSAVKVRRSNAGLGDQRGKAHIKVSTHLTNPDNNAAPSSTFKRVAASRPWL